MERSQDIHRYTNSDHVSSVGLLQRLGNLARMKCVVLPCKKIEQPRFNDTQM